MQETYLNIARACMMQPGRFYQLKTVGDNERVETQTIVAQISHVCPWEDVPTCFLQKSYFGGYYCVWLSMALLVSKYCQQLSTRMITALKEKPGLFKNLMAGGCTFHNKKVDVTTGQLKGLIENKKLDGYVFGGIMIFNYLFPNAYQKHGIRFKRIKCGMDQAQKIMIDPKGYYVGFLRDTYGETNHAVAINSIDNKIYDSSDDYALKFNDAALDLCTGEGRSFSGFSALYYLEGHISNI